jgi:hypothetical protein
MYIPQEQLLAIEQKHNVITVQSDFPEIIYGIDRMNGEMWIINRQTGAQMEIAAENAHKLADEIMSVAEVYLRKEA